MWRVSFVLCMIRGIGDRGELHARGHCRGHQLGAHRRSLRARLRAGRLPLLQAARADLLRRLGARDAAADAYARALELAGNAAEWAFLARRLAETRG
jgi:predicted RNA polymerase sigma factor